LGEGVVTVSGERYPIRARFTVYIPDDAPHASANTGTELLRLLYVFPCDSFGDVQYEYL
jgi:oxalate decarboxylase/phosphoglucose isomerase-like protein (cupin superfamily)